jgi:hypothetical protein
MVLSSIMFITDDASLFLSIIDFLGLMFLGEEHFTLLDSGLTYKH